MINREKSLIKFGKLKQKLDLFLKKSKNLGKLEKTGTKIAVHYLGHSKWDLGRSKTTEWHVLLYYPLIRTQWAILATTGPVGSKVFNI